MRSDAGQQAMPASERVGSIAPTSPASSLAQRAHEVAAVRTNAHRRRARTACPRSHTRRRVHDGHVAMSERSSCVSRGRVRRVPIVSRSRSYSVSFGSMGTVLALSPPRGCGATSATVTRASARGSKPLHDDLPKRMLSPECKRSKPTPSAASQVSTFAPNGESGPRGTSAERSAPRTAASGLHLFRTAPPHPRRQPYPQSAERRTRSSTSGAAIERRS